MTDIQKAYHDVYLDIITQGPDMFTGYYDAVNGSEEFMFGIQTVM